MFYLYLSCQIKNEEKEIKYIALINQDILYMIKDEGDEIVFNENTDKENDNIHHVHIKKVGNNYMLKCLLNVVITVSISII